ncbi:MAG TPA: DUF4905 domain-containing protein [Chryseosolibacter sp.]|nr:DUF4905 domain-containing protein [Chryseosolibacter sp.]
MLADGNNQRLFLEIRNPSSKTVSFSALNLQNNQWLWKDLVFEEPWWISLRASEGDVLLFTIYTDENNPDKKSVLAYNVVAKEIIWWRNGFSLTSVNRRTVSGVDMKFSGKESILDLFTGQPVKGGDFDLVDSQNFPVIRPFQYEEGTEYFVTVKDFLHSRLGISPVASIEYLEINDLIIVSVFLKEKGLANYLYVLDANGGVLMEEKLGEDLKGIGLDTFFVFSDNLIFIKNKNELLSYSIV